MITIAICDDIEHERCRVESFVKEYMDDQQLKVQCFVYDSGEALCKELHEIKFDIIFLDIYMDQMTGLDVARQIREDTKESLIIFTTSSEAHALEAYSCRAFQYLLKPIEKIEMEKILKEAIQYIEQHKGIEYIIATPEGVRKVKLEDIYYIESSIRKTVIHFKEDSCICIHNINTLESKLMYYGFVRCHRSFIVNLKQVKMIKQSEIELNNGDTVFLSKYKQKDVKKQLVDYCGGRM